MAFWLHTANQKKKAAGFSSINFIELTPEQ
jgi:hypothetical protein